MEVAASADSKWWMSNYAKALSLYWGYVYSHTYRRDDEAVKNLFIYFCSTCLVCLFVFPYISHFSLYLQSSAHGRDRNRDDNTITARGEISVIIVWQAEADEKLKSSTGPRSQLVHTDPSVQDRSQDTKHNPHPTTLRVKQTRSYLVARCLAPHSVPRAE